MATKEKTKNFKSERGERNGQLSLVNAIQENGLLVAIVLLCATIDTGLFSGFAPYIILNGPTPQDSLYSNIPTIVLGGFALFLCGYGLSTSISSQVRSLMVIGAAAIKVGLALSVYLALSAGNFDGGLNSIGSYLLVQIFCSIGLYIAIASSKTQNRRILFVSFLVFILEASKILYFTLLKFNPLEIPLKETVFSCTLGFICLLFLAGLFCFLSLKYKRTKKKFPLPVRSSLKYQLTLLTVTISLSWIPFIICLINYATASDLLIKLTTILSTGIILGVGLAHSPPVRKYNLPTLTFLLSISLLFLTLSKWFVVSAISLFIIGLVSSSIIKISIQDILSRINQSAAKDSSICVAIAVILVYSGSTILSNSSILLPATYLMQQIGCIFFCLFLLITVSFKPSQAHLVSTIAAVILNLKGGTGGLKATYKVSTSGFIVSKLSLLKSLAISNYLSCPLIVFSNDGLLNWKPICILLGFFNTKVYHTAEELEKIEDQTDSYNSKPLLYIHRDTLQNQEKLSTWTYLVAKKDSKSGSTVYSLDCQQPKPKAVPYIVSSAS